MRRTVFQRRAAKHFQALLLVVILPAAGLPPGVVWASDSMPTVQDVATQLSNPQTREQALHAVTATAQFLRRLKTADAPLPASSLQEDMDWLKRLNGRWGIRASHSPVLDPAAWFIHLELERQELETGSLISPLGAGLDVYLGQVFDRSQERLASAMLPELLWLAESLGTIIWSQLLEQTQADESLAAALFATHPEWMQTWSGSATRIELPDNSELLSVVVAALDALTSITVSAGPPDRNKLMEIRHLLLSAMPGLGESQRLEATGFLRLAELVDGLHQRRYFAFAEGLLAVAGNLLNRARVDAQAESAVAGWLSKNLPLISSNYAKSFALVDPRLNAALAAAYDVVQSVSHPAETGIDAILLHSELADAVAQLALLIPDLDFYFNLPVRDSIAGGVDACIGIMARREKDGSPAMTRDLYDDCQQSIVELADTEARAVALSGDPDGPFGEDELARELSVTSGQRINYGIAYLHNRYTTGCSEPVRPLPNPLEWSALATLLAWFAEQSPVYFQTPENEARLVRMRNIGRELLQVVAAQVDCFAGAGALVNDPVSRSMADYRDALVALSSGINGAVFEFRGRLLAPGADAALHRDATQTTAYRPDDLLIGPCNAGIVCEMTGSLSATRALLGLFPDEFLIADQTGLGNVEICYTHMEWVQRRSELVREDDINVANYHGRLAFDLMGRYVLDGVVDEVFGFRFTSPNEHHYLFAAATEEVLQDNCPVEWIGQRIVTPLKIDRGVVPNRLTYLAAPRMLPSRLLTNNWDRGAEWRDWFITGIGVVPLELDPPRAIGTLLNQHLQTLYRAEQNAIYNSVLRPGSRRQASGVESLFEDMTHLTIIKSLIRNQLMLFYPQLLTESDELRSAIAGQGGLLDALVLARFRADNVPVDSINGIAFERLDRVQREWQKQPEATRRTGSIAISMAHALMRLNTLYKTFFAAVPD